jgi:protein-S-isoprenylcysteine O-methyltransferase Ste14
VTHPCLFQIRSEELEKVTSTLPRAPVPKVRKFTDPEYAKRLLDELLDRSKLGTRGEGWFLAQGILLLLLLFAASGIRQLVDVAGWCLVLTGIALITGGSLDLGSNLTPLPAPRDEHSLVTDGVYELCRHPMYGGIILGAGGLGLATGSESRLAIAALLFVVLNYKSNYEEQMLEDRYPTEYREYKAKAKKFIPYIF